jgi:hypothetical protein
MEVKIRDTTYSSGYFWASLLLAEPRCGCRQLCTYCPYSLKLYRTVTRASIARKAYYSKAEICLSLPIFKSHKISSPFHCPFELVYRPGSSFEGRALSNSRTSLKTRLDVAKLFRGTPRLFKTQQQRWRQEREGIKSLSAR